MILQVLLSFSSFFLTSGFPTGEYYVNPDSYQQYVLNYQPGSVYYYPDEINKPIIHKNLGMSPQYQNLVYNYVKDFAGTELPLQVHTFQPNFVSNEDHNPVKPGVAQTIDSFGAINEDNTSQNGYALPSDFLSSVSHPKGGFFDQLNAVKTKRMNSHTKPTSLPPINGVISHYVLMRNQQNPQNLLQAPGAFKENESDLHHNKRQIPDDSDGVVILAEPTQNIKNSDEMAQHKEEEIETHKEDDQQMEAHPGIAQSKPSAIALAGPGGMAQASPVGTALVGQGGLAVAAPSGTAVAGPAGQGAIPIQIGNDKQKTTEKKEEPDTD